MKRWCLVMVWCMIAHAGFSQTWKEWFQQKKTQIEYLEKQIAALRVYIELGQKGYGIYQDGLTIIGDLKKGDLDLHADHFASLKRVKPSIGESKMVAEVFQWQSDIERIRLQTEKSDVGQFKKYVRDVFDALVIQVNNCTHETKLLTTDQRYQLTDDERMQKIKAQHALMQEYFGFSNWMQRQVGQVTSGNKQEQKDAKILKSLMDIP